MNTTNRAIEIGRDAEGNVIVSGDNNLVIFEQRQTTQEDETPVSANDIGRNPYKSLAAFHEQDVADFFGREAITETLLKKFADLQQGTQPRVLPLLGPSGCGKSSLARAGLIAALARESITGLSKPRIAVFTPSAHPLEALATMLARIATGDKTPVAKTREFKQELQIKSSTGEYDGLRRIADSLPDIADSPVIVLIDQFEELYTLCESSLEQQQFIDNLLCAAADVSKHLAVILSLRSDFLAQTQEHSAFNALLAKQGEIIPVMNSDELRAAISLPAERAGHSLDDAVIELLLKEAQGKKGVLPLLQFALTRIWEGLRAGVAAAETLEKIGGVGGALAASADKIYQGLDIGQQQTVQRAFMSLVQLGEGARDTRRRATVGEMLSQQDDKSQVLTVLRLFAEKQARLLTLSADKQGLELAEITHEALFEHWQLLGQWIDENRDDIRFKRRLSDAVNHWQAQNQPEGSLWSTPNLDELQAYYQRKSEDLTPLQLDFYQQSLRRDKRAKRLKKMAVMALAGLTVISAVAAFYAYQAEERALKNEEKAIEKGKEAIAEKLASNRQLFDSQMTHASLMAKNEDYLGAKKILQESRLLDEDVSPEARHARNLLASFAEIKGGVAQKIYQGAGFPLYAVAVSPDGALLAASGEGGTLVLFDVQTGAVLQSLEGHATEGTVYDNGVRSIAFTPDGNTLISAGDDKQIILWQRQHQQFVLQKRLSAEDKVRAVAISPDGKLLATGDASGVISLWELPQVKQQAVADKNLSGLEDLTGLDSSVNLMTPKKTLKQHTAQISESGLAFNATGKLLASASYDDTAII